jgi:hypothetical protein
MNVPARGEVSSVSKLTTPLVCQRGGFIPDAQGARLDDDW